METVRPGRHQDLLSGPRARMGLLGKRNFEIQMSRKVMTQEGLGCSRAHRRAGARKKLTLKKHGLNQVHLVTQCQSLV